MAEYTGSIELISGIRPKNNGTFPLVNAKDVMMPDGTRLSDRATSVSSISLSATAWIGEDTIYTQAVDCEGVTSKSRVDLLPSPDQLRNLLDEGVSLMAANSEGAITVFAIGGVPSEDMTIQVMITEVTVA